MPRYALTINDLFVRVETQPSQPANISHKLVKWLPCDPVVQPSFDPLTEKVTGPTYTVGASAVTEVWTKVSLSAQEVSDAKDAAVGSMNGGGFAPVLKAMFNLNNRVRVLEGQAAITLPQFKAAIKALL